MMRASARICALLGALISSNVVFAGNVWDGGGSNNNWTTGANWNSDNQPPANNGLIDVVMSGNTRLTPNVDTPYNIHGMFFLTAGAFTLGGQTLTIGAGGVTQGDAQLQTISNNVSISTSQTWDANLGDLRCNGTVNLGGITPHTLNVSGNFTTTMFNRIQGFGTFVKFGDGTLVLTGSPANTYIGATIVNGGTLVLNKLNIITAIPTNLTIGDGNGIDVVRTLATHQIAATANVSINSSGVLNMLHGEEQIAGLTMTGGTVSMHEGMAEGGSLLVTGAMTFNASPITATFDGGIIDLNGVRTFDIPDGAAPLDLLMGSKMTAGTITKSGAGTMRLTRDNSLGATVTVNAGELQLATPGGGAIGNAGTLAIGDDIGGTAADRVVLLASNQVDLTTLIRVNSSGLLNLNGFRQDNRFIRLNGGQITSGATGAMTFRIGLQSEGSDTPSIITGNVEADGQGDAAIENQINVLDGAATDDLIIDGKFSAFGSELYKTGPGQLRLTGGGVNEFVPVMRFTNGTIALSKSVADGALKDVWVGIVESGLNSGPSTLRLEANEQVANSISVLGNGTFDMNGFSETLAGFSGGRVRTGGGVLTVSNLNLGAESINTETGTIQLLGSLTATSVATMSASLSGQIHLPNGVTPSLVVVDGPLATDLQLNATLYGGGGWMKTGDGILELTGAPIANTGTVTIAAGTVLLNKTGGVDHSIRGALVVGDGAGLDVLRVMAADQLAAVPVNVLASGQFDLNGFDESIASLTMSGGTVTSGAGILQIGGEVLTTAGATATSTISGNLDLAGATRALAIGDGSANVDLDVSADVRNGGITKSGLGTMRLAGANTYAGGTTVNGGRIVVASETAFGTGSVTLAAGTLESQGTLRAISPAITLNGAFTVAVNAGEQLGITGPFENTGHGLMKIGAGTLAFSGVQSYAAGSTLDVNDGAVRLDSDAAAASDAELVLRVNTTAAQATLAGPQHLASISITNGRASLQQGSSAVLVTRALSVDNSDAQLDIADGAMIVNYSGITPIAAIRSSLMNARNGGAWDGFGITSSAAAAHPTHSTSLGLMSSAEYLTIYGPGALFEGEPIDATAVLVKYTWYGDTDFNGVVNFDDYSRIDGGFNNGGSTWLQGDFNYDQVVNFDDYALIDLAFNTQSGTLVRALSFLEGGYRSSEGMNTPALRMMLSHAEQFGDQYAKSFINAVPEPMCAATTALLAIRALPRRKRRAS